MPVRTIRVPVAEVLEGGTKQDFYGDLRKSLYFARRLYNAALTECASQDSESFTVDGSVPKTAKLAPYTTIVKGKSFAAGFTPELSNICRAAESKYKLVRYNVLQGKVSLPIQRSYPWPLLCHKGCRRLSVVECDGSLTATLRLMGGQWKVRLRSGSNYRDQIKGVANGEVRDSKVHINHKGVAVLLLSVALPVQQHVLDANKTLRVTTTGENLFAVCRDRRDDAYLVNADAVRDAIHRSIRIRQRQRCGVKPKVKRLERRKMFAASQSLARRTRDAIHKATSQIISLAIRGKYGRIEYDDTIRSYCRRWPWHEMFAMLQYKCEDRGIQLAKVATAFELCEQIDTPHIYFRVIVDIASGQILCVKIGKTLDGTKRCTTGQMPLEEVYAAAFECKKSNLSKTEKKWLAEFSEHRIKHPNVREAFEAKPVLKSLCERGAITETLGGSRLAEILETLGLSPSGAIPRPKASRERRAKPLIRETANATCDYRADFGEGVASYAQLCLFEGEGV